MAATRWDISPSLVVFLIVCSDVCGAYLLRQAFRLIHFSRPPSRAELTREGIRGTRLTRAGNRKPHFDVNVKCTLRGPRLYGRRRHNARFPSTVIPGTHVLRSSSCLLPSFLSFPRLLFSSIPRRGRFTYL